jgi:nucleoside-diphosphate-sugar epimerase
MAQRIQHIIVTGGTGYIGSRFVEVAWASGYRVTLLGRRSGRPNIRYVAWSLGEPLPDAALDGSLPRCAQAVVHLAHDWQNQSKLTHQDGGLNIEGTRELLVACRQKELGRFVFASSQSARADAPNIYGRVKWAIEQQLERPNEVAARIGLVYGGRQQAMYGLLTQLTRLAPILPMVDPHRAVQPIHCDELARGLLLLSESDESGWIGLASSNSVPFGRFLKVLARELHGRKLVIFPIPLKLACIACDLTALVPFIPTVDRERVLGLSGTLPMQCTGHLRALGLELQPFEIRLPDEPRGIRTLLSEGKVMLTYVLRSPPSTLLMRRYARAVRAKGIGGALALAGPLHWMPALLRWLEPIDRNSRLSQHLALATALLQASPEGERMLSHQTRFARIVGIARDLTIETISFPFRIIFRQFWS